MSSLLFDLRAFRLDEYVSTYTRLQTIELTVFPLSKAILQTSPLLTVEILTHVIILMFPRLLSYRRRWLRLTLKIRHRMERPGTFFAKSNKFKYPAGQPLNLKLLC